MSIQRVSVRKRRAFKMVWNNRHRENDVFSIALWIYVVARVCGLFPFSVKFDDKSKSGKVYMTLVDYIWAVGAISFFVGGIVFVYLHDISDMPYTLIEKFIVKLTTISGSLILIFSIYMDIFNRHHIWSLFVKFHEFDTTVCFYQILLLTIKIIPTKL